LKAITLSAGQGKRLMPLTADRPKCLLPVGDRTLIEWQLHSLAGNGIDEVVVVVGFMAERVEERLARVKIPGLRIRVIYNPFFAVSDNLASCFLVRHEMDRDFVLINGDTISEPAVLGRVLKAAQAPITVTMDRKDVYDADDMKVSVEGDRLIDIGKTLTSDVTNGESIGMLLFKGEGPALFRNAVEAAMKRPEGLKLWYLSVIAEIARSGHVGVASIEGLEWGEVDFPADVDRANELGRRWLAAGKG
jgi:choline kinase